MTQARGVDISEGMVKEYNKRAQEQGFSPQNMCATQGDLLAQTQTSSLLDGAEFFNFDLAIVDMGFHHFEQPDLAVTRLVERLKPGIGVLVIVDWAVEGGEHHHGHRHGHGHGHGDNHDVQAGHSHGGGHQDHSETLRQESLHTVAHHGFSKERMITFFKHAGCIEVEYLVLERSLKFGQEEKRIFMARGRRA